MPDNLKDSFFPDSFIQELGEAIQRVRPTFDRQRFARLVLDDAWAGRELKARMRHITHCLHETLPAGYAQALGVLLEVAPSFGGFQAMVFCDYVECYGLDRWDLSLPALKFLTRLGSAEFAIRPYLAQDPERGMASMRAWAKDEDPAVRRLASEGCRPRLPWAMALPRFKDDPGLILPVLEALKDDPSESVRRSVANNLNDISKDHPELVLGICERWLGHSKERDWIVKHACRTMLKAGDRRAMLLFGFGDPTRIRVEDLTLDPQALSIGECLHFAFDLRVDTEKACKVRLELGVYYVKARGTLSRKVFQIREDRFDPGTHSLSRRHWFRDLSTRKHYPGEHKISIIVNGVEMAEATFELEQSARS
jgi:3-methyladenine DNA glycosylase AlkC